MIKKPIIKITALLVIISLNWTGLLAVGETISYFNDTENSAENIFSASTLDFSIPSAPDFSPDITPTQNTFRAININNDGSLDFDYSIKSDSVSGDLCSSLNLSANLDGVNKYAGPIDGLDSSAGQFGTVGGNWQFEINLTSSDLSLQNQTCAFDFVFDGVQIGGAGFFDTETISNAVNSGTWTIAPPPPVAGDVVINELMWPGSDGKDGDEWLELRNMTGNTIDIGGWQLINLVGATNTENLMITIPTGKIIPAYGFFLISNYSEASSNISANPDLVNSALVLRNNDLQIKLYKGDWQNIANLIDTADDGSGSPVAGSNGTPKESMERNDVPGDGTLATSWHTCVDASSTALYWDAGRTERGTPGAANLSTNDPIVSGYESGLVSDFEERTASAEETTAEEDTTQENDITDNTTMDAIGAVDVSASAGEEIQAPGDDTAQIQETVGTPVEPKVVDSSADNDAVITSPSDDSQDVIESVDNSGDDSGGDSDASSQTTSESSDSGSADSGALAAE